MITYIELQTDLTLNSYWYHWCLSTLYYHVIEMSVEEMLIFFYDSENDTTITWDFLMGYATLDEWLVLLHQEYQVADGEIEDPHIIIICHRPYYDGLGGRLCPLPIYYQWKTIQRSLHINELEQTELYLYLCFINKVPPTATPEKLVYTSYAIQPDASQAGTSQVSQSDPFSQGNKIPMDYLQDSQDPWPSEGEINLNEQM